MTSIGSSSSIETSEPASADAELAVGLLSDHDAETIAGIAAAVRTGLVRDFAGVGSRVLIADAGSGDGTLARAKAALGEKSADLIEVDYGRVAGDLLTVPYHGLPGRARALRAVLSAARDLGARGCVVLDGGLRSIKPEWIAALAGPVLRDSFDYVSPHYLRHPCEGALTKGIVYPLFRALYGVRLRQPAAGEFGCSARLIEAYLDDDLWERDGAQIGIDVWLAAAAAAGGFKLCEVSLGARSHRSRGEEALGLDATLVQVIGAAFADLESQADVWQRVRTLTPVPVIGETPQDHVDVPCVDVERLIDSFQLGCRELRDIWSWIVPPKTIIELRHLANTDVQEFRMADETWARIIYDFALGYRLRVFPREHLLGSLTPLYRGWLASFVLQVRNLGPTAADARIEQLAGAFEAQKPYLVSRWRWPERFRT
jgi:glucosylglycerate synthase